MSIDRYSSELWETATDPNLLHFAKKYFHTDPALCLFLGVSRMTLCRWRRSGKVPVMARRLLASLATGSPMFADLCSDWSGWRFVRTCVIRPEPPTGARKYGRRRQVETWVLQGPDGQQWQAPELSTYWIWLSEFRRLKEQAKMPAQLTWTFAPTQVAISP